MNQSLLPTPDGDYYYNKCWSKEANRVTVTIYDPSGQRLEWTRTQRVRKPGITKDDTVRFALNEALEKLNRRIAELEPNAPAGTLFYSEHWNALSLEEQIRCANISFVGEDARYPQLTYFENNVLPRLDDYGPEVTPEQCEQVSIALYRDLLERKKFTSFRDSNYDSTLIASFETSLIAKSSDLHLSEAKQNRLAEALSSACIFAEQEERLCLLLHHFLSKVGIQAGVDRMMDKLRSDCVQNLMKDKDAPAPLRAELVFLLRELSGNEQDSKRTTNQRIIEVNAILAGMRTYSHGEIPDVQLPLFPDANVFQTEKRKTLLPIQRLAFASMMFQLAPTSNYALAALIMLVLGPRTEEVCAMVFGQVVDRGEYGVYTVTATNKGQKLLHHGKNRYFSRLVIFTKMLMDAFRLRREHLMQHGYTLQQINSACIACSEENPMIPIHPIRFSAQVKEALKLCGCEDSTFEEMQREIQLFEQEQDPVAYLLRHDAISVMTNFDGMHPLLVDALVGHVLPRHSYDWTQYLRDEDNWATIARQLERFVYHPAHTMHPAFCPIHVTPEGICIQQPVQSAAFHSKKGRRYRVVLEIPVGTETVSCDVLTGSALAFSSAQMLSPIQPFLILPLPNESEYRRAQEVANKALHPRPNSASQNESTDTLFGGVE